MLMEAFAEAHKENIDKKKGLTKIGRSYFVLFYFEWGASL